MEPTAGPKQAFNARKYRENSAKILIIVEALESLVGFFLALDYALALQVSSSCIIKIQLHE